MPTFIFFHGIAINTANMLSGEIWHDTNDDTKSRLYITTENAGEQHALDVDYDTARDEWDALWTDITTTEPMRKSNDVPVIGSFVIDNATRTMLASRRAEEIARINRIAEVAGTINWSGRLQ